jgi:hypothetical protein
MRRMRWTIPFLALVALLAFSVTAEAKGVVTIANLSGSAAHPGVNGKAKYKVDGTDREFEVEIQDANRLRGQTLTVVVNGKAIGTMRVNSLGDASLERSTELGQSVPHIIDGSTVRIKTAAGVLVAKGTF